MVDKTISHRFSRAAGQYDEHAQLQQLVREECIKLGNGCWDKNAAILDIGHGTGSLMQDIKSLQLKWDVTGVDIAFGMCAKARQNHPNIVNASADALPFADASFDGVFSSLMLQWVAQPLAALREMARVVRPGGRCVIATFTHGTLEELRDAFTAVDDARHVNDFIDGKALSACAVHAGFTLLSGEEETFTGDYPDVVSLMRSLKAIGASTTLGRRAKGLMTRSQLERLERRYRDSFATGAALPASWQVMYLALEKN